MHVSKNAMFTADIINKLVSNQHIHNARIYSIVHTHTNTHKHTYSFSLIAPWRMLRIGELWLWGEVGEGAGKEWANDPAISADRRLSGETVPCDRLPALRCAADGNLTWMDVRLALCSSSGDSATLAIVCCMRHTHTTSWVMQSWTSFP